MPIDDNAWTTPRSSEDIRAQMHLESYYKDMYEQGERTYQAMAKQLASLRKELRDAQSLAGDADQRARVAGEDADEWRRLAMKLGTDVQGEWRKAEYALHGELTIAADLLYMDHASAVSHACLKLANTLRKAGPTT